MLEWVLARGRRAHVLLTKSDKLNRRTRSRAQETNESCRDAAVSAQLFSAHAKQGFEQARGVLNRWLDGDRVRVRMTERHSKSPRSKKKPRWALAQPPRQTNPAWG